ncbi:unnamed protein product [Phaedon cochleariae]|uniref:PPM-type phosphatase domain-containing protein n=1 Tax=Phaedon cochleariae TaxID=80249 RepID=A0A9P0DEK8_PHACE|nr:unnamed protein product [Phaedon cochleariae]
MPASIGVNLRVTGHCRQGGRKYMEDFFSVAYQQTEDEKDLEYAFFGIYDGHGGAEAAAFAKEHLMETIIKHKNFWSDDDEDVLRAIKDGYMATHYAMWREQEKWPRTASGLPSTAGTTASVAFIRRGKIYIGHVGDSGITLGYQEPGSTEWKAKALTKDHKPENSDELARIKNCGGNVVTKSGVPRVVWNRPKLGHQGPVRRSTPIDEIPFLAVARSLGDLWSYNYQSNSFIVSPDPDCCVLKIDTDVHRCLVFGTDGLYNMLSTSMAVHIVQQVERHNENAALSDSTYKTWLNPSKLLVEKALDRWHTTKMRADNTSVVTLMLDPPGPPRAQVLKDRKKNLPERGLKIMTRFDDTTPQESISDDCDNASAPGETASRGPSPRTTLEPKPTTPYPFATPTPLTTPTSLATPAPMTTPTLLASPTDCAEDENKSEFPATESAPEITSVSSSDLTAISPLKERNFLPKARESTSFDPRELTPKPSDVIEKENQKTLEHRPDDTIQCNEVSSSNIEPDSVDKEESAESSGKTAKRSLRSGTKEKAAELVPARTKTSKEQEKPKISKRKIELEQSIPQPRKSIRIDNNSKKTEEVEGKDRKAFQAEEKLKRLAKKADLAKQQIANPPKPSLAQKILRGVKEDAKKKSGVLNKPIAKKKIQGVLHKMKKKSSLLKTRRVKTKDEKKTLEKILKAQKAPKVAFQRYVSKNASQRQRNSKILRNTLTNKSANESKIAEAKERKTVTKNPVVDTKTPRRGKAGSSNVPEKENVKKTPRNTEKMLKVGSSMPSSVTATISMPIPEESSKSKTLRGRLQQKTESLKKNVMRKK